MWNALTYALDEITLPMVRNTENEPAFLNSSTQSIGSTFTMNWLKRVVEWHLDDFSSCGGNYCRKKVQKLSENDYCDSEAKNRTIKNAPNML